MTIVERVARALCRLDGHPENAPMDGKPLWQDYLPEARAAIEAMREPTPEMLDRVQRRWLGDVDTVQQLRENLLEDWQTMINAALGKD